MIIASLSRSTASVEEALVLLLVIAATVAVVARRVGVPYTIGLVVVGLVVGLVSHIPSLSLSSDLVFYVFLPILLFEAGFNLEAGHLLTDWRRIAALAIPGVLVAFALTGVGVHWLGGGGRSRCSSRRSSPPPIRCRSSRSSGGSASPNVSRP